LASGFVLQLCCAISRLITAEPAAGPCVGSAVLLLLVCDMAHWQLRRDIPVSS
jgi:hypothetical protein